MAVVEPVVPQLCHCRCTRGVHPDRILLCVYFFFLHRVDAYVSLYDVSRFRTRWFSFLCLFSYLRSFSFSCKFVSVFAFVCVHQSVSTFMFTPVFTSDLRWVDRDVECILIWYSCTLVCLCTHVKIRVCVRTTSVWSNCTSFARRCSWNSVIVKCRSKEKLLGGMAA